MCTLGPRLGVRFPTISIILPLLISAIGSLKAQETLRNEFDHRIVILGESDQLEIENSFKFPQIPADFDPWWSKNVNQIIFRQTQEAKLSLDDLIILALKNSSQIKVFSELPLIRQTAVVEADSAFDWRKFVRTRWDDLSEPVGNILTTGGSPRLRTNDWTGSAGLRKRNQYGGAFEVAQEVGHENSNSNFFRPNNQGTSRLRVSYTHPILRGSGSVYNQSLVVLASVDTKVSEEEFSRQLQSHLLEISRAFWSLHLERITFIQKQKALKMALEVYERLSARRGVDIDGNQLVRTEAVITDRKADLVRAAMAIRNAQDRLHTLVDAPELNQVSGLEIVPKAVVERTKNKLDVENLLSTAVQMRPEVNQALHQVRAATIRLGMSQNEVLPQLDLVFESYVAGLRGNSNIGSSFVDQFRRGEPGYSIGLQYELPIQNRAAQARLQRRELELRQLRNQFRTTVETLFLETRIAAREVRTAHQELRARFKSMEAASKRLEYVNSRWSALAGRDKTVGLFLDDLLGAQDQLTKMEFEFAKAEVTYNLALTNLKKATGMLLQHEKIEIGTVMFADLPETVIEKLDENVKSENIQPLSKGGLVPSPNNGNNSASFNSQNASLTNKKNKSSSSRVISARRLSNFK